MASPNTGDRQLSASDIEEAKRYATVAAALDELLQRTRALATSEPSQNSAVTARRVAPYVDAFNDDLRQNAPERLPALARRLSDVACGSTLSDAEWATVGYVATRNFDIISAAFLDCSFAVNKDEDPALWSLMDAWRLSRLPMPDDLASLQGTAKDERTTMRFRSAAALTNMRAESARALPIDGIVAEDGRARKSLRSVPNGN